MENFILKSDAYKQTHHLQYPEGTEYIYSYYESRGGEFDKTVFFGLQYILKRHFKGIVVTQEMIEEAEVFCKGVFGCDYFNRDMWQRIVDVHGGKLPIEIKAVPEGSVIPVRNVLLTVINTDPLCVPITNFVETILTQIWYPITVATTSYRIKKIIAEYCKRTDSEVSPFHLNDFGYRGSTSHESASIGGLAHLTQFDGTDTLPAIICGRDYYGGCNGFSVMATEHSTTTIFGRENEIEAYKHFLKQCPTGVLSVVSDSYNIYNTVTEMFGRELKDEILSREGIFVIRPDSGDPVSMSLKILEIIWSAFGGAKNNTGHKVLHPKVRMIYGDSIDVNSIDTILDTITSNGFAAENIIFGSGSGLLQKCNRDTHQFAFKCCAAQVNGKWHDVYKDPVTDHAKFSKRGRLKLVRVDGAHASILKTRRIEEKNDDILETVFKDGDLIKEYTFNEVKENCAI